MSIRIIEYKVTIKWIYSCSFTISCFSHWIRDKDVFFCL